jgi:hypothetical protein
MLQNTEHGKTSYLRGSQRSFLNRLVLQVSLFTAVGWLAGRHTSELYYIISSELRDEVLTVQLETVLPTLGI